MVDFLAKEALLFFIPIFIVLFVIVKKEFLKLPSDPIFQKRKASWQRWILFSRTLIVILLLFALAEPFTEIVKETQGDPRITVLIDNSSSMGVFDMAFVPTFLQKLQDEVPVVVRYMGSEDTSDIGEGILAHIEEGKNLLLITDGYNNFGANLGDVSLFASRANATVSALDMLPLNMDASVSIVGPNKVVADLNSTYVIKVSKANVDFYHLVVSIDGVPVLDIDTDNEVIFIDKEFKERGYHTITATVSTGRPDHFEENNVFYKVVNVIEKPKILYLSDKGTPLELILDELYDVTKLSTLPSNLDEYYSTIIYDMPESKFRSHDALSEYLIDGNGLVVFGGFNSFDRGSYKNSVFEQLLPVTVGAAERKFSDNTIVLAIDRSKGGGKCRTIIDTVTKSKTEVCSDIAYTDVIKAQAVELIEQLDPTNKVGVVAFDTDSYRIEPIDYLYNNKERILDKVTRIKPGGNTLVSKGLRGGYTEISNEKGNRYIILLTDGVTWVGDREESVGLTGNLFRQGIKVITVGIGRSVMDDFLKTAASNGGGFYVPANDKGKLKVLFGDPEKKDQGDNFALFVLNTGHFITRNLDPDAVMSGYNQVLPKSSAELVISTDSGEPALSVWRYGLGKVAAWNVFSGGNLGDLLNERNSLLLTRTVNWAIGDPERKKAYFVNVGEGRTGKSLKIEVKSDKIPSAEGLNFIKVDRDIYEASILTGDTGFGTVLDARYAVNYPLEYEDVGFNPELSNIVSSTGGNLFKQDDIESIVKFVRSVSKRTVTEKTILIWPFLWAAMILFLLEVMLRRLSENKKHR